MCRLSFFFPVFIRSLHIYISLYISLIVIQTVSDISGLSCAIDCRSRLPLLYRVELHFSSCTCIMSRVSSRHTHALPLFNYGRHSIHMSAGLGATSLSLFRVNVSREREISRPNAMIQAASLSPLKKKTMQI